ncbi:ABC transporter substrate-binding protein [Actinomyces qiguomingii]|uniref:ABC transporter substrate-binding protein n=1 Tax=Actinomyces qiguomingii TaxID=2057800 RepID=UPI000CA008E4|nr:ABC transporter substrate-binding protein [Actinomyces qiguomingii]
MRAHSCPRRTVLRAAAGITTALPAILAVGACSSRSGQDVAENSATLTEPIVITDQRDKTHTFTRPITSIVTTVIPSPSILTAIDQSYDRIDGVNESTVKRDRGSVFETMFPQAVSNDTVANSDFIPNVEEITRINPDVVIQWADQGDSATYIDPIEAAGYPVIGLRYGTQEYLEQWIQIFATLLQRQERGQQILRRMHQTIASLKAFAAEQNASPTVLFLRSAGDSGYNAGMSSTRGYMNTWMTLCGATNIGADVDYSTSNATSVEQLLAWDPQIIFVSSMTALTPADLYADSALSELQAVRNHRVYAVPSGGFWWDPPSAESHLMMMWAAQIAYPDTAAFDLREQLRDNYDFLYGYSLSEDEIDQILRFDDNTEAQGYEQFSR